jgi:hypothetical protein
VTLLLLNQQRADIGGWAPNGKPVKLPGGHALEHTTVLQVGFKNKENLKKDADGLETLSFNEHAFKIDKCKMHGGIRQGEYQLLRRDHEVYALTEGEVDDATTMLVHAKRIGCYTGGGQSWTLDIPGFKQTFRKTEEAIVFLYENRDIMWLLRNYLIADHARKLKLPDYFVAYLMGEYEEE